MLLYRVVPMPNCSAVVFRPFQHRKQVAGKQYNLELKMFTKVAIVIKLILA